MRLSEEYQAKKESTNGIKKKDIITLLKEYSPNDIENGIVSIYCKSNGIVKVKNNLIQSILDNSTSETEYYLTNYLNEKGISLNIKTIEKIFELLLTPEERKINGSFYTPDFLLEYITNNVVKKEGKVCDPACGSGAFLSYAVRRLAHLTHRSYIEVIEKNIYGADILKSSVRKTKIILSLIALDNGEDKAEIKFNLFSGDSLTASWENEFPDVFENGGFDAIIGNPPYVRAKNLPIKIREKIKEKWYTASVGNIDLYIPFVELALLLLNEDGEIGFVLPNTYATSYSARKLREVIQNKKLLKEYLDFNHLQVFPDVSTYICITILNKKQKDMVSYAIIHDPKYFESLNSLKFDQIKFPELKPEGWRFLVGKEKENIKKIENTGVRLGVLAKIKTGIATLRNDLYVLESPNQENSYYLKSYGNKEYRIEKEITRGIINAGNVKDVEEVENNKARIIFPYRVNGSKYELIPEKELKEKYPYCYDYLLAIRNELEKRDKGTKKYPTWYAYGRTQGIAGCYGQKLLVPTIYGNPHFIPCYKPHMLVYSGYEICYNGDMEILEKVLNSQIMWYYIKKTGKPYAGGFMSFAKTFIKNFSIPEFTEEEKNFLHKETDRDAITKFLIKKYDLNLETNQIV